MYGYTGLEMCNLEYKPKNLLHRSPKTGCNCEQCAEGNIWKKERGDM
jgi:hypothetical protein